MANAAHAGCIRRKRTFRYACSLVNVALAAAAAAAPPHAHLPREVTRAVGSTAISSVRG